MVGGTVFETRTEGGRIWLNVRSNYPPKRPDECAIYVERNQDSERIRLGDSVWWQGRNVFWTRKDRSIVERAIPRASYSGVDLPENYFDAVFD